MKKIALISLLSLAATFASAETTVTMTGVHNCCGSCAKGIKSAAADLKDVTVTPDGETVTIVAKRKSDAKKAAEAIIAAGYYGKIEGEEPAAKSSTSTAAKPEKMTKATVSGVHLCCKKCSDAVTAAVKTVPGITKHEIAPKTESFTVEGDFTKAELVAALNDAGFAGEIK